MTLRLPTTDQAPDSHIGKCALCDTEDTILRESHSIPKFAYHWVKETSSTPYLRGSDDVNVREQDGPKEHLLCDTCEGELSSMEQELSEKLFKKIANYRRQTKEIEITEKMRVGVLSIFWRSLLTTLHRDHQRTAEDMVAVQQFLDLAKQQIKEGVVTTPIHITPFRAEPPLYGFADELTYMLHRMVGAPDIRFFDDPHRYYAVFKLPFMFFHIRSSEWGKDLDPESAFSGTLKLDEIQIVPAFLEDYIHWLAEQYQELLQRITPESLALIERDSAKKKGITGSDKSMAASLGKNE